MPQMKSVLAQLPRSEQLRERAINWKRLVIAFVNESFALKLRALAEEYEGKAGGIDERKNR